MAALGDLLVATGGDTSCPPVGRFSRPLTQANAIVNVRFTTSQVAGGAAELYAYGTAVIVRPVGPAGAEAGWASEQAATNWPAEASAPAEAGWGQPLSPPPGAGWIQAPGQAQPPPGQPGW